MNRKLIRGDALALADVLQQLTGVLSALALKHLPANDAPAEQIHKQVEVEVNATHQGSLATTSRYLKIATSTLCATVSPFDLLPKIDTPQPVASMATHF